jgi:hypothetical protein
VDNGKLIVHPAVKIADDYLAAIRQGTGIPQSILPDKIVKDDVMSALRMQHNSKIKKGKFSTEKYYTELLKDPVVRRIFKERHGYELSEKNTGKRKGKNQ